MSRFALLVLTLLPCLAFSMAEAQNLHVGQELRGAVAVDMANDGETVVIAIDEGGDGSTDFVLTADLDATPKRPIYYRFDSAEVHFVLGEKRVQISAPDDGGLLLLGKRGTQLLDEPDPALTGTPALWFETRNLGYYRLSGEERPSLEEAIESFRHSKAEAKAAREARRKSSTKIVPGTENAGPCPEGQGGGGLNCDVGGCGTEVCGRGGCNQPYADCLEICNSDESCCGGCYRRDGGAHCECLTSSTYCSGCETEL